MTRKVIDAEFEVVSGPSPVRWERPRRRSGGILWYQWAFVGLLVIVAGYTALLGLAGADLDTRAEVAADAAAQPVAAALR